MDRPSTPQDKSQLIQVIRDAEAPFNHATADLIFRSSDLVDFRVHKTLVSLASPVFQGLVSLPTPPTPDIKGNQLPDEFRDGLPVIPFLAEDSQTLLYLLCSCHGFAKASLPKLDTQQLKTICAAHDKYAVTTLAPNVFDAFASVAKDDPVAVYAIACQYQLSELKIAAARLALNKAILPTSHSPELDNITGSQYADLLQYHTNCGDVARKVAVEDWTWIPSVSEVPLGTTSAVQCGACLMHIGLNDTSIPSGYVIDDISNAHYMYAPAWWYSFMHATAERLKGRPHGNVIKDRAFLAPTMAAVISCDRKSCRMGVLAMIDFCERFAAAVDNATSKVAIPVATVTS